MSVNNRKTASVASFQGQKSGLPIESYGLESGEQIQNFLLKEGALVRANGGNTYAEVLNSQSGGVSSLHRFKNLWVAQRGAALALEDSEGAATFSTIDSSLTSTRKLYSSQWRDRAFFVNGQDATFNFSGSGVTKYGKLGLDPPDASAALPGWDQTSITSAAAGNVANGSYAYLFTFYDEVTNTESPAIGCLSTTSGLYEISPNGLPVYGPNALGHTVSGGPKTVVIANMAQVLADTQALVPRATHFIIYRATTTASVITGVTHGTFNRVPLENSGSQDGQTIIRISSFISEGLNFIDNTASLPAVALPTNNSPPPTPARMLATYEATFGSGGRTVDDYSGFRHAKFFRDQLFGFGAYSPGLSLTNGIISNSGEQDAVGTVFNFDGLLFGSEVFQPDYYPYIWEVAVGDGQTSIGLGVLGDTALLLFKDRSTYYLSGSSPDNYIVRVLDTNKGCVNESTIQETPKGVICLDRSGFVLFDKIGLGQKISKNIQDVIDNIDFTKSDTFYSWFDPKDQRYFCAVVTSPYSTPNLTLCLDLDSMEWTTEGTEFSGLSRMADTDSDGEYVELMGSATNGRLVDLSNPEAVTINGQLVESIWTSGPIDFGDDQHKKRVRWLYLRCRCDGPWTIGIEVIPDYDESRKFSIESFNVLSSQSTWYSSLASSDGTLIWDEDSWAFSGLEHKVVKIPIICKGYSFQIRIINRDTDPARWGFAIESVSVEAVGLNK